MILSRYQGELLVVGQPDHGTQVGLIAAAWVNGPDHTGLAAPPGHDEANRLAAAHHDDGWAIWERRPDLDPRTGRPVQFYDLAPPEHLPAYRAGIERAARLDPWTGLLVSMHGAGLYNDRYGSHRLAEIGEQRLTEVERTLVEEFLADMAELQRRLYAEAVGHPAPPGGPHELPAVLDSYLLLQVWDRLSLQFVLRHGADGEIAPLAGPARGTLRCRARGPFVLALDPYPFVADRVELPVVAALVADRAYRDPEDFLATLAAAGPTVLECAAVRG